MKILIAFLLIITSLASFATDFKTNYAAKALASLNKPASTAPITDPNAKAKATENLKTASLLFIENNGQVADNEGKLHPEILFTAKAAGAQVYVTGNSIHYVFTKVERAEKARGHHKMDERDSIKSVSTHRFTLELEGANPKPELVKQEQNPYYENYYLAHCPNGVVAHSYEKFTLKGVYPGVDWVIYSNGQGLKHDFVLAKGSDAAKIRLKVKDAKSSLNAEGDLVMNTSLGKVVEDKPVSFQARRRLETSFVELGNQTYGFEVNANANQPLTIDPSVAWATYYGGSGDDWGQSCATDASGNVYLAGTTSSTNFPVAGAFQGTFGGRNQDAFLVKFNSSGSRLWATYYGGSSSDGANFCATDASGNVYFAGSTSSTNFPVAGAFQGTFAGGGDAFLVKFTDNSNRLWATYYGGSGNDDGNSCTIDNSSNVYLAGSTSSTNFPVAGPFQGTYGGAKDAFLVKFSSNGGPLWATYYGGSDSDQGFSCATDASGNVYLSGNTVSTNFPVAGAFQGSYGGGISNIGDAFMVKFSSSGSRLWATYYGGSGGDQGFSCATDASGNVYLSGSTNSTNFPVAGAFQGRNGGGYDAFLVKFSSTGSRLWATYYGGSDIDQGFSCATDATGNVYLAGFTWSTNFPVAAAIQGMLNSLSEAILVKFNSTGSRLWATYYGGIRYEGGYSCTTDTSGNVYLSGYTLSSNFPVAGAFQGTYAGNNDAFLVKFSDCTTPTTPTLTANGPTTFCAGDSLTLTSSSSTGYLWSNGATTQTIKVSTSGNYTVQSISGACISAVSATTLVTVNPLPALPSINFVGLPTFVPGDSVILVATGGTNYLWSNNATTDSIIVKNTGVYSVISIANGCSSGSSAAVEVTVVPTPQVLLRNDSLICSDSASAYLWYLNGVLQQQLNSRKIKNLGNGLYTVRIVVKGCTSKVSTAITQALKSIIPSITIAPNPAHDHVDISGTNLEEIQVTNVLGITLINQKVNDQEYRLDTKGLITGHYILRVRTSSGMVTRKLVID